MNKTWAFVLVMALVITTIFASGGLTGVNNHVYADDTYPWTKTTADTSGNYIADSYGLSTTDTIIENVPTDRLLDILSDSGTHYILFSNPSSKAGKSELPQQIVKLINEKAKALGINKIYHYDTILDDYQLDITDDTVVYTSAGATQSVTTPASWGGATLNKSTVTATSAAYAFVDSSAADIGGVNNSGHIATWVGRIWTFVKAKFPTSSVVDSYKSGDVLLLRFNKAAHQTLPSEAAIQASAHFQQGTTYMEDGANTAIETAFKDGSTVVKGDVRTQYEFFKRTYDLNASYFNTNGNASANKTGTGVEIFKDSDFPNGQGFKFKAVTVPELYNVLNSSGYKPVLFASTACHNTQAIVGSVALKAKTSTEPTVYVLEPSLSGTFLTGEGENIDKIRFSSATGGVHIRNNRNLTASSALTGYQYSYLYGEIGRSFIPNLRTEQASKKSEGNSSGSIGYYQNGFVDNFTVSSSNTWTNTYPWATGDRKATARLQIPYFLGYEKGQGQTKTWLHKKTADDGTYSEYMLDLTFVLETDLAKALEENKSGSDSVDLDGFHAVTFAQEAVAALENVLPQQVPGPKAFAAAPAPTITGTAKVGQTLTAEPGAWSPWPAFSYQWYADGQPIAGATQSQYQITASDVGKSFTVAVTAAASGYITTTRTSAQTEPVEPETSVSEDTPTPPPTVTAKVFTSAPVPTINGVAKVGNTLGLNTGSWTPWPAGAAFSFQWYADGKVISGATKNQYKIAASDVGKKLTVSVTATAPEYDAATKTSSPTAKVAANKFGKAPVPKITGAAKIGKTLNVKVGTWSPKAKYTYQWYANGKAIKGATKAALKLKKAQKGKKITVKVTGKKSGYNAVTKTSKATKKVR